MSTFGMQADLEIGFDDAVSRVRTALGEEGFGVLTEIDVSATLAKKLGVAFRRYTILGACNPPFAHEALELDLQAGLMMPCNVVVYERDDGKAVLLAVDPTKSAAASGDERLVALAGGIRDKLARVLERTGASAADLRGDRT